MVCAEENDLVSWLSIDAYELGFDTVAIRDVQKSDMTGKAGDRLEKARVQQPFTIFGACKAVLLSDKIIGERVEVFLVWEKNENRRFQYPVNGRRRQMKNDV